MEQDREARRKARSLAITEAVLSAFGPQHAKTSSESSATPPKDQSPSMANEPPAIPMSELSKQIESLRNSGTPWTGVFRKVLPLIPERLDPRMTLFRELRELYGFNIGTLLEAGAWNVWEKDGLDDEKVNHLLDSSIPRKE